MNNEIQIVIVLLTVIAISTFNGCSYNSCGDLNMRLPGCSYDETHIESLGHGTRN